MNRTLTLVSILFVSLSTWGSNSQKEANELLDYFFAAARTNNTEVLSTFAEAGFPVDASNQKGYTALMVATYNGQRNAFDYLLKIGANPCLQDNKGNTALMAAIFRGELSMTYRLMQEGCDTAQTNKAGNDAKAFAEVFGRNQILQKLKADKAQKFSK
ncbi:ankyrin repeat domain-containing protein [Endozoicomonas gorgoniicola]|uniref:Ankyrin repeat domain-containing protein n=1 Tax=Endozoicomonas gorgoniicola TaxID=1234144 RepID=A0ABT3MTU6_9GAMM|nr:ankyrin repeat domain-containing protein [Endozoicomonas gorgoniicola]MCW7552819.1 ankyrin repeat domain-containing protein [Endozoicomonas gorgoniicola]MCW7553700.1 ankyrin repeat domain-containing protein [Endozoicomonas gorgoniicola]